MSAKAIRPNSTYRVRFSDCDPLGHLNNSRYIDYMLNAREDHLRDAYELTLDDFLRKGTYWVVTNHEIQYRRPAFYNEMVFISSALIGFDEANLWVECQMWNEDETELKALLWSRFTVVDAKSGKRSAHPGDFLEFADEILMKGVDRRDGIQARIQALTAAVR